jgi:hypothetical protein
VLQRNGHFSIKDRGNRRIQIRAQLARSFGFNQQIYQCRLNSKISDSSKRKQLNYMQQRNDSFTESHAEMAGGTALLSDNNGGVDGQVDLTPSVRPSDRFAEFDPAKLRLDQSTLAQAAAKKLRTTIPIRKPSAQDFIRVNPNADYRLSAAAFIELKEDREIYLVLPGYVPQLGESEYFTAALYLYVNRQQVLALWPVKLPRRDGRTNPWNLSAQDAAERAMKKWIQVRSNMSLGAYEISQAEGVLSDPEWPTETFKELLSVGFKGRIIHGPDHPVIQKLRGLI